MHCAIRMKIENGDCSNHATHNKSPSIVYCWHSKCGDCCCILLDLEFKTLQACVRARTHNVSSQYNNNNNNNKNNKACKISMECVEFEMIKSFHHTGNAHLIISREKTKKKKKRLDVFALRRPPKKPSYFDMGINQQANIMFDASPLSAA